MVKLLVHEAPLPNPIKEGLHRRGFTELTPPQAEAIGKGLLRGRNVVVAAPTASGKTLVAEIALVNAALNGRMGVYATPLRALASEKYEEFRFWEQYGLKIGISTGDYDEPGEELGKYDIVVATYERLDSILRHKPSWISRVGVIVIDELHSVADPDRGPIVELIATRALHLGVQLVGLSATIGNPEELASWLDAELVKSTWRPVELVEGYYDKRRKAVVFGNGRVEKLVHSDLLSHVALKALEEDYQVLVFKQSRRQAEQAAARIARLLGKQGYQAKLGSLEERLEELGSRMERDRLSELMHCGVAFHHAGLSHEARRLVEEAFRCRALKVVVATPTLAAGINLPARRVVVYTLRYTGGRLRRISVSEYKQMAGRAGRPQYDPVGEVIIADADPVHAETYIYGELEPVDSKLWSERALRIHILATIASGYASRLGELHALFSKTLASKIHGTSSLKRQVARITRELEEWGFIESSGDLLEATRLGELTSKLYIDPLSAKIILKGLEDRGEVGSLYYLHLVALTPDFARVRVGGYMDLEDLALTLASEDKIPEPPPSIVEHEEWLRAFKVALILYDWVNEEDEDVIVSKHGVGLGDLAGIIDTAAWLTYAASRVARLEGLSSHADKLARLSMRVRYGVKEDLLDLVRAKGVGRVRARTLASAGIRTLEQLAEAKPEELARLPGIGLKLAKALVEEARRALGVQP